MTYNLLLKAGGVIRQRSWLWAFLACTTEMSTRYCAH